MALDKFKATWVSHSSISDFLLCPRRYYLRNVYKDPRSGNKITIMTPPLALGLCVHEVVESLSVLPVEERLKFPLQKKFDVVWKKVEGKKGGFLDPATEDEYKKRGYRMLSRVENSPGPVSRKAVKIGQELPNYWFSEEDEIILCGKIDWLEWIEEDDSIHIIDFKTGKNEEGDDSLQLPIYHLLATNTQNRKVSKVSYWYLDSSDAPIQQSLPELGEAYKKVYEVAKRIKLARQINHFKCPRGEFGCFGCRDLERVVKGEGELVAISDYNQDVYILNKTTS